jgi:hypothetical protein
MRYSPEPSIELELIIGTMLMYERKPKLIRLCFDGHLGE